MEKKVIPPMSQVGLDSLVGLKNTLALTRRVSTACPSRVRHLSVDEVG